MCSAFMLTFGVGSTLGAGDTSFSWKSLSWLPRLFAHFSDLSDKWRGWGTVISLRLRQEALRAKIRAEHIFRGCAHPAVEHGGVDGAEIDGVFQVAVLVKVAQIGRLAKDALVDGI